MSWITGILTATYRYYQTYILQATILPGVNDTGLTLELDFLNPKGNIELNFQNPKGTVTLDFPDLINVDDV